MQTQVDFQREILRLQRTRIVEVEQLALAHKWLDNQRLCRQSGRILGESCTGKTSTVVAYQKENATQLRPGLTPTQPVVRIQVPEECSAKDFYTLILEAINYKVTKGTAADLRRRVKTQFKNCEVEMLIIDEAAQLQPRCFADVRDLSDNLDISVILVGTDRLDTVIGRDEQVENRFYAHFHMAKLNEVEFAKTFALWETQILKLPVPSNLTSKKTLTLLKEKTGSYIGHLDLILRRAAIEALKKGEPKITLETLKEVVAGYGYAKKSQKKS